MLGKNSTALLMCAAATFVHAQASPDETLLARALQEAADTEIEAAPQETAFDEDDAVSDPIFDEVDEEDLPIDIDVNDSEDIAEEDDRSKETDNDYVAEAVEEMTPEDEMVEAADQDAREKSGELPPDADDDLAEGPPDDDIFDEDDGLDNEDDYDLLDEDDDDFLEEDEDDDDLLEEDDDDDLSDEDRDELLLSEKAVAAREALLKNQEKLGLSKTKEKSEKITSKMTLSEKGKGQEPNQPEGEEGLETAAAQSNSTEYIPYYNKPIGPQYRVFMRSQVHHAYGNVDTLQPLVYGKVGGEHASHHDGKAHDDCDDCTAEADEEKSIELGMFLLVAGSLTLLVLWLMFRQCKQGSEEEDKKKNRSRRSAQGYAKPSQTANDEVEMSTMDDIENNF